MPVWARFILAFSFATLAWVGGLAGAEEFRISDDARRHWAFQPVRPTKPPAVRDERWPRNDVDRFLLAALEAKGLHPSGLADKPTLIRRATFDLTGLPPTPEEVDGFLADQSPDAFAKLVDRLLASRAYGEKWGRHWLDVVRYADTAGDGSDYPVREAYKYRNWVIGAFNNDKPYDQFVREQIAGDIYAREGPAELMRDRVIATGYLAISKRFGYDTTEQFRHLDMADTIEVVGRSLLGLSVGCARCHDHKYDPISEADYYGLYGIFNSTQFAFPGGEQLKKPVRFVPLVPRDEQARLDAEQQKRVDAAEARVKAVTAERDGVYTQADGIGGADFAFELQVPDKTVRAPWTSIGPKPVVSAEAQSPFTNVYPSGVRGMRFPGQTTGEHGIVQLLANPRSAGNALKLNFNLDFRNHDSPGKTGEWRVYVGETSGVSATFELRVSQGEFLVRNRNHFDVVRGGLRANTWYNVQLTLDMVARTYHGSVGRPGDWVSFSGKAFNPSGGVNVAAIRIDQAGNPPGVAPPTYDLDNLAITDAPLAAPTSVGAMAAAVAADRHEPLRQHLVALRDKLKDVTAERDRVALQRPYELAYGVAEGDKPADVKIHKRGEPHSPGKQAPRRFIEILGGDNVPPDEKGSGRRQLAEWIARPGNPLTARVMVNRVWQWHFGRGIVATASDFGLRGSPPTHPDLLDHLASQFVSDDWSIKRLHRRLMLSAAYQMSSVDVPDNTAAKVDPDNTLLWKFPRRRLLAEEVRDSMLAVAGTMDRDAGGEHPFPPPETWAFTTANPFYAVYPSNKRSVYLMVQRFKPHPFLSLWDAADPNISAEDRPETITPKQALYLMNDPFVHEQSAALAKRSLAMNVADDASRVTAAWKLALGREPDSQELADASAFLAAYRQRSAAANNDAAWAAYARALLTSNGFLYVD